MGFVASGESAGLPPQGGAGLWLSPAARAALLAALVVAAGSCIRGRLLLSIGLPLTLVGLGLAAHALWCLRSDEREVTDARPWVLGGLVLVALVGLLAPTVGGRAYDTLKRVYYLSGLVSACLWAYGPPRRQRTVVLGLAVAASLLQLATPAFVPDPFIDSWAWTQSCLRALAHGIHPYTVRPADILHGTFYATGSAPRYPYMPATLLVYLPMYAAVGEYRYLLALSCPVTLALVWRIGRLLGVPPVTIDAVLLAILLHPRVFTMVCFGWLEPLLATTLAGFVLLTIQRRNSVAQAALLLLLPGLKQYALAPVAWFLATRAQAVPTRVIGRAVLLVGASVAPFLVWNAPATVNGMLSEMAGAAGPSLRSTSLAAALAVVTGTYPTRWLSAGMQFGVAAYAWYYVRDRGLGGLLLGSALALLATFLTAWQAFVNYFYFVTILLAVAALILSTPDTDHRPGRHVAC